jgi:hypothetical protein
MELVELSGRTGTDAQSEQMGSNLESRPTGPRKPLMGSPAVSGSMAIYPSSAIMGSVSLRPLAPSAGFADPVHSRSCASSWRLPWPL